METSPKRPKDAITAGLLYLVLIVVGMYAFISVFPQIKIDGNISATIANIKSHSFLFRVGIICAIIMNIVSIALAIILCRLFTPVDKGLADFMLYFLLVGATISLINEVNHFALLTLHTDVTALTSTKVGLTALFVKVHKYGSYIAVVFWGVWLFPLGVLVYKLKTRYAKFLGVMLVIAGLGYLVDSAQMFLLPKGIAFDSSDYACIGEFLLTFWLLFRSQEVQKRVDAVCIDRYA